MNANDADPTMGGLIQPPSFLSLYLRLRFGETQLASGTGFLVMTAAGPALITARHNLTGRDNTTGQCLDAETGGVPDRVEIFHNGPTPLTNVVKTEILFDDEGNPRWIEHPKLGQTCDVVLLPLTERDGVLLCPYQRADAYKDIALAAGDRITVVGFVMGRSAGAMLAIWCTGYVASEPALDYAGLPQFLIDCRTRKGQSGSPVIAHREGTVRMADGSSVLFGGGVSLVKPFGVYSGRLHPEADVGIVWKWSVVEDLIKEADVRFAKGISGQALTVN